MVLLNINNAYFYVDCTVSVVYSLYNFIYYILSFILFGKEIINSTLNSGFQTVGAYHWCPIRGTEFQSFINCSYVKLSFFLIKFNVVLSCRSCVIILKLRINNCKMSAWGTVSLVGF